MTRAGRSSWFRVGRLEEIPARGARVVTVGERAIALFRTSSDRVFALLDRCPHRGGPLSQGIVHGDCVTCPLHDWVIHLDTGEARAPDEGSTESFPIRLEDGTVFLGMPELAPGASERSGASAGGGATAGSGAAASGGASATSGPSPEPIALAR